jgi:hypothetical protein
MERKMSKWISKMTVVGGSLMLAAALTSGDAQAFGARSMGMRGGPSMHMPMHITTFNRGLRGRPYSAPFRGGGLAKKVGVAGPIRYLGVYGNGPGNYPNWHAAPFRGGGLTTKFGATGPSRFLGVHGDRPGNDPNWHAVETPPAPPPPPPAPEPSEEDDYTAYQ